MNAPPLLERDDELAALRGVLDRAAGGTGGVLAIEGPAGIGKSGLLRAARSLAAETGLEVLFARGGELEQEFPHGVVRQLIERPLVGLTDEERAGVLAGPAALAASALGLDDGATAPGAVDAFAVIHGLYWLIANLAEHRPLVLVVDDAHWADLPSLEALVYLGRRVEGLPIALVLGTRREAGAQASVLAQLVSDPATTSVEPRPLTSEATAALVEELLGAAPEPPFAAACHAATHGNPFLLRQLCDAVRADGLEPTAASAAQLEALGPRTVGRSVLLRLGHLPARASALAQAVAVLGEASRAHAGALAELESADVDAAAAELAAADVLAGDDALGFVHPIVRSAVYADISPTERSDAHARAARVLTAAGAAAGVVAQHLLATQPSEDPVVADMLRRAAAEATRAGATESAARMLSRALAEPPAPSAVAGVLAELGIAELTIGEPAAATTHLAEAVGRMDEPLERARAGLWLARARAATEGIPAAIDTLEAAIADAEGVDHELVLRLEAELASIGVLRDTAAPRIAARLERHADLTGQTVGECLVLANLARHRYLAGAPSAEVVALARLAIADGRLLRAETAESLPFHHALYVLSIADETEIVRSALADALAQARATGSIRAFGFVSLSRAAVAHRTGDVTAAEADARATLDALGDHGAYVPLGVAFLVQALVEQGRFDDAEAVLAEHGFEAGSPAELTAARLLLSRARLRLESGKIDDALADLEEVAEREERWGHYDSELGWRPLAAFIHRLRGEEERARQLSQEQLERVRRTGPASALGAALRGCGLVATGDEAIALLEEAVATLEPSPARLELARAKTDLGGALRRRGRRPEARDVLREALELARACGAVTLADRADEELRAAGAKPRRQQFSGPESLTASERRVAALAADGLGNREIAQSLFVTVKTVENHLARVYQKLGVSGRAALPELLRAG